MLSFSFDFCVVMPAVIGTIIETSLGDGMITLYLYVNGRWCVLSYTSMLMGDVIPIC